MIFSGSPVATGKPPPAAEFINAAAGKTINGLWRTYPLKREGAL
jgi:hypothetical protein